MCSSIAQLPESLGQLTGISKLGLVDCGSLQAVPASLGQLQLLHDLLVSNCNKLEVLPASIGQLSRLQQLTITGCSSLQELPDAIAHLSSLTRLFIQQCNSLNSLPNSSPVLDAAAISSSKASLRYQQLLGEYLSGKQLLGLPALLELHVESCDSFSRLPASLGQMSALTKLYIKGCGQLGSLPASVGELSALKLLHIEDCPGLSSIPTTIGQMSRLTSLCLSGCSSLQCLPEFVDKHPGRNLPLAALRELNLAGCSQLVRVPESLCQLSGLRLLDMSHCSSLVRLGDFMSSMVALNKLDLSFCNSLEKLPRQMPPNLQQLDLSYCSNMFQLAEELVELAVQVPDIFVFLQGWDALMSQQQLQDVQQQQQQQQQQPQPQPQDEQHQQQHEQPQQQQGLKLKSIQSQLRKETIIKKLLTDKDSILDSLERLSWLAVLLAAGTFTGAIAPPGGYDNGLLFLPYSESDCPPGSSDLAAYSTVANCSIPNSTRGAMCPIGSNDLSGSCIQAPDTCTDGIACRVKPQQERLQQFFRLDLLSFGFSMALVMFVVACSMPRQIGTMSARAAGTIWLSLVIASALLAAAVACGMGALIAGMLAVYPVQLVADINMPYYVTLSLMACAFWILVVRWVAIFPGKNAVSEGILHALQQVGQSWMLLYRLLLKPLLLCIWHWVGFVLHVFGFHDAVCAAAQKGWECVSQAGVWVGRMPLTAGSWFWHRVFVPAYYGPQEHTLQKCQELVGQLGQQARQLCWAAGPQRWQQHGHQPLLPL